MGINVGKVLKEIATNRNTIVNETKQLGNGLVSGTDPTKALEAFMENNKDNPAVLKFMEGLNSEIPNNPTAIRVANAIDSRFNSYVPLENDPMKIVTNSGTKTITPKDLPPEAVKAISNLYGEPKFWNSNKGVSVGDVDLYDSNLTDKLVAAYNNDIKKSEIVDLYKGKPFNKDLAGKIGYNLMVSGLWGSAGSDATKVANRINGNPENGNPDDIWTNPTAVALMAALTRGGAPLIRPAAKLFGNAKALSMAADVGLPFVGAKVLNHATTPNEVENNSSNTNPNTITVDALNNSKKGNTSLAEDSWN